MKEALKLALEALENHSGNYKLSDAECVKHDSAITAIKEALVQDSKRPIESDYISQVAYTRALEAYCDGLAQPEHPAPVQQEPMAWKLVPKEPTREMLEAMDECSMEGYDERLLAGHAASVYMAAVDAAPTKPQRTWVGLTDEDIERGANSSWVDRQAFESAVWWAEAKLKEKNGL